MDLPRAKIIIFIGRGQNLLYKLLYYNYIPSKKLRIGKWQRYTGNN